jgi:hypothetical protein
MYIDCYLTNQYYISLKTVKGRMYEFIANWKTNSVLFKIGDRQAISSCQRASPLGTQKSTIFQKGWTMIKLIKHQPQNTYHTHQQ